MQFNDSKKIQIEYTNRLFPKLHLKNVTDQS